jgi:hypothetical protein
MKMPLNIETELTGLPSGQVIYVYNAFIPTLYNYGLILYRPELCWTFKDEDEYRIQKIINRRDLNLI